MKYFIKTFGCAANIADSERIAGAYRSRGWTATEGEQDADEIVINTCMIRQTAEDRVVGLLRNIGKERAAGRNVRIIVTGCMVGMATRDKSGKYLQSLKRRLPEVDEFMPIEEVGFSTAAVRTDGKHALVIISNGCNNFCTFCVVPYTRGREVSRPVDEILAECRDAAAAGARHITLVGQNVNSYGSDIVGSGKTPVAVNGTEVKPVYVKSMGKARIPTLFPYLLSAVCTVPGVETVDFISSNPWDFSDELIGAIAAEPKISRAIHLPVQSGDRDMLKKMNRWYTPDEYLRLADKIRKRIPGATISTDIIVGFPGETEEQFANTVSLCRQVGFSKAYISMYSDRNGTVAHKLFGDDISHAEKKRRWEILDELINKTNLRQGTYR